MKNLRNRRQIKPVKPVDTEAMKQIQNSSTSTGFDIFGNFDCLVSENQTVTSEKPIF